MTWTHRPSVLSLLSVLAAGAFVSPRIVRAQPAGPEQSEAGRDESAKDPSAPSDLPTEGASEVEPSPSSAPDGQSPSKELECEPCEKCESCPACPELSDEKRSVIADEFSDENSLETYGVSFASRPWEDREGDQNDWLRTTSGEWLQGELKSMREDELSFDSDEFDLQSVDWDDVAELHLPRDFDFVLDDKRIVSGPADMVGGKLVVHTATGDVILKQREMMSVTQAHASEISRWYFKLSLGASLRRGNTQSADYSAFSRLRREDPFNRATLDYNGSYGLVSEEVNTNKHRGDFDWDLFVSPVVYLTPLAAFALYDRFQNIELRTAVGAGGGIHLVNTNDVTFDVDAIAGYVNTRYISIAPDSNQNVKDGMLVVPSLSLEWDITGDIDLDLTWQSSLVVTSIEDSFHHGTARLSVEITDIFDLELSAIYDRQESPVPDEDGETPLRDDLAMTLAAALEFE